MAEQESKPKMLWEETVVRECTLENGVKIIMHLHFGEYAPIPFEPDPAKWKYCKVTYD